MKLKHTHTHTIKIWIKDKSGRKHPFPEWWHHSVSHVLSPTLIHSGVCLTTERSQSADIRWSVQNTPWHHHPPTASEHAQRSPARERQGDRKRNRKLHLRILSHCQASSSKTVDQRRQTFKSGDLTVWRRCDITRLSAEQHTSCRQTIYFYLTSDVSTGTCPVHFRWLTGKTGVNQGLYVLHRCSWLVLLTNQEQRLKKCCSEATEEDTCFVFLCLQRFKMFG